MNKKLTLFLILSGIFFSTVFHKVSANEPDSVYLFSYTSLKKSAQNGLHFAWSTDKANWHEIGSGFSFLNCDYGSWGSEKRMFTPFLYRGTDKKWHCVWTLNQKDGVFAYTSSTDLVYWKSQSYPEVMQNGNVNQPEIDYDMSSGLYTLKWLNSKQGSKEGTFLTTTKDFKSFSPTQEIVDNKELTKRKTISINGSNETGVIHKVAWSELENLFTKQKLSILKNIQNNESLRDDSIRFAGLKPLDIALEIYPDKSKKISDKLIGVFFEDINYAADGGLYAELIQNCGFEYTTADKAGRDPNWNSMKSWSFNGSGSFTVESLLPLHINNPHFAVLTTKNVGDYLANEGFNGIALKAGENYNFSIFVRNISAKSAKIKIQLVSSKGEIIASTMIGINSNKWKKYSAVLTAKETVSNAGIQIVPQIAGTIHLDMVSLFPRKTFKNRPNGLRADLAQAIADLQPKFVRFPGGCVAHGDGIHNIYKWKNTVGPLESRKPMPNIWRYHQSMGLGYFEYFQFCEDVGAEPLPVLAAGVPCQNSATGGAGQQGGIPLCEMDSYIQDVLDLIEWANGDAKSKWGKIRASAGHPKPFNLKYIGIGNEDLISDIFEERFKLIFNAIKEKYPEMIVVGTTGPFSEGTDYVEGWRIATELKVPVVDEHYYQPIGWFLNNQDFYDRYDRSKSKVYLGEYASWGNTWANALVEALYLTGVERNGDVVSMTSYAPLIAKEGNVNWNPDLIYFTNSEVKPTVNYYIQKLYGQNSGDSYLPVEIKMKENDLRKRIGVSVVSDSKSGDLILKLVNVLPVECQLNFSIPNSKKYCADAVLNTLSASTSAKQISQTETALKVAETVNLTLKPYSFTVLRLKSVQK